MAVHTHITEGINLPRSASPNVSITAPPGTTPALLVAASRQLIREKSESGREGKPGERGQSAAFGSFPQRGNPEKHASNLPVCSRYCGMLASSPARHLYLSASLFWNIR